MRKPLFVPETKAVNDLLQMFQQRIIGTTEALKHANRAEALATAMRGIKYTGASQAR